MGDILSAIYTFLGALGSLEGHFISHNHSFWCHALGSLKGVREGQFVSHAFSCNRVV